MQPVRPKLLLRGRVLSIVPSEEHFSGMQKLEKKLNDSQQIESFSQASLAAPSRKASSLGYE